MKKFAPAIYEHAAKLIGKSPWEVSRSEELIFQAHAEAYRTYSHRPITVGINIYNPESEAYGAKIGQPEGNDLPAIKNNAFSTVEEILDLPPLNTEKDGRISMIIRAGKRLAATFPEAEVRIPVSGPFSLAGNLLGMENLLIETVMAPDVVQQALEHLTEGQFAFCEAVHNSGLKPTVFESAGAPPLLSPKIFIELLQPVLKSLFTKIARLTGAKPAFIIGGDAVSIVDAVVATGVSYIICPAETDQAGFMERMKFHPEVTVRINMQANVIASANWDAILPEIERVKILANGRVNTLIGSGVLPYEVDPRVVFKIDEYLANKMELN